MPGVGDPDQRIFSRRHHGTVAGHVLQKGHRLGRNADCTACRHGVAGVDHQVDHDLLHLPLVGPDQAKSRGMLKLKAHAFPHQAVQKMGQV